MAQDAEAQKGDSCASCANAESRSWLCGWWRESFLLDYLGILVAFLLLIFHDHLFPLDIQEAIFSVNDPSVLKPLRKDSVPIFDVFLMMLVPSVVLYVAVLLKRWKRNGLEDFHAAALGIAVSLLMGNILVVLCKFHISKARPDLVMRCAPQCMQNVTWACAPDVALYDAPCFQSCCPVMCDRADPRYPEVVKCSFDFGSEELSNVGIEERCSRIWGFPITISQAGCFGDMNTTSYSPYSIRDAFNAFPSGHIGNIWALYVFNWLYIAGKFELYKKGNSNRMFVYPLFLMSAGLYAAFYVGLSRITDYKHDAFDVFFGALFTTIPVFIVYPIYFESICVGGNPLRRPRVPLLAVVICRETGFEKTDAENGASKEQQNDGQSLSRDHENSNNALHKA